MVTWDQYWENYSTSKAEHWLILERNKILNKYLDKLLSEKKKIIEIGCGSGANINMLKEMRTDVECHTLDNSKVAYKIIKQKIPNSYLPDCRETPFEDNQFDLIFSAGLMEHHKNEKPFLDEMKRILDDNGYLVTFIPARISLWQLYQLFHLGQWQHGYEKSYTYNRLTKLFKGNNFKIVEIVGIDPFSINGFLMKLLNKSISPISKKSFIKSGYQELCIITQK